MLWFITTLLIRFKLWKSVPRDFSAHAIRFRRVYQRFSFHRFCFAAAQTGDFAVAQNSTEHCSILEWQTCISFTVWHTNTACLVCIECTSFFRWS